MNFARVVFEGSFPSESSCPTFGKPEMAFLGRSNVGKSSFLNALWGRRDLAHTSKKPGKTKHINFFNVDDTFMCVDLPGYGYARISKEKKEEWRRFIPRFIERRQMLYHVFLLIDSRHMETVKDEAAIAWVQEIKRPFTLILTKSDKSKQGILDEAVERLGKKFECSVFCVSAKKASTFDLVRAHVCQLLQMCFVTN